MVTASRRVVFRGSEDPRSPAFGGSGSEDPRTCTFVGMGSGHGVVAIAVVVEAAVAVGNRSAGFPRSGGKRLAAFRGTGSFRSPGRGGGIRVV